MIKKYIVSILIALACFFTFLQASSPLFEMSKQISIFMEVYKTIQSKYVEELDPASLMQTAIKAVLKDLDPYTVYIPESKVEQYRIQNVGTFGGVGIELAAIEGRPIIVAIEQGSPAALEGFQIGQEVRRIGENILTETSPNQWGELLRGQVGNSISIERVSPSGTSEIVVLPFEEIGANTATYAALLGDSLGYISLKSFTKGCSKEVEKHVEDLAVEAGVLSGLVLDLRDNPGGLLFEAVDLVNLFVPKGELVVYTKGKHTTENAKYTTRKEAVFPTLPVVVLINERSASASEIVSGVLQDLDRGVVIGNTSFGKGLVQQTFPMEFQAQMKVTISKYYIPSGRCIQAIDYKNKENVALRNSFKTRNGRTVKDGKGIDPDIFSTPDSLLPILTPLVTEYVLFQIANTLAKKTQYASLSVEEIQTSESLSSEILGAIKESEAWKKSAIYTPLTALEKEPYWSPEALEILQNNAKEQFLLAVDSKHTELIDYTKGLLAHHRMFPEGLIRLTIGSDYAVSEAKDILSHPQKYDAILHP